MEKMAESENKRTVCPVEKAGGLDNKMRKWLQNPEKILKPYIKPGMTAIDLGCGPGFFTIEIARLTEKTGKVIAVDLQEGMLEIVRRKIAGTEFEQRIELHKCEADRIGLEVQADFVLAFYMVHEVPDKENLFRELGAILKPDGILYIIEPNFHVSKKSFEAMLEKLDATGFEITEKPKSFFNRAVIVKKRG